MPRFALRRRVEEVAEPLLFVVAPAGFGKTSILADWATGTSRDTFWFTCRQSDHDRRVFWRRLLAALADQWPATGDETSLLLSQSSWHDEDFADALAQDLDKPLLDGVSLVIDDSHLATSSQGILTQLASVLPRSIRLLVASQHNLPFSSSRLHLSGVYAELRSRDLSFTRQETDAFLDLVGLDLVERERQQLQELTQGWPAGVQLAALAMRNADNPADVMLTFATSPHAVSDYLVNEVLDRMTPELVDFMTRISVLGEFDLDLCRVLTGDRDAGRLLDGVIEHDVFIQQTDAGSGSYRFHPMFNAFLQARLRTLDPDTYEQLHRRALAARHVQGDLASAVTHATAVHDLDTAAALVTESFARGLEVGNVRAGQDVARAWLDRVGAEMVLTDPQRVLEVLLVLTSTGTREPERWLSMVGKRVQAGELATPVAVLYYGAMADYMLNRGQTARCLQHSHRAEQLLGQMVDPHDAFGRLAELPSQQVGALLLAGDLVAAAHVLEESSPIPHAVVDGRRAPILRSWIAFLMGDLATARQGLVLLDRADTRSPGFAHDVESIFIGLIKGGLALEEGRVEDAARALARTAAAAERNGRPVVRSLVDVWLARLATAQQEHDVAVGALVRARLVLEEPDDAAQQQLTLEMLRVSSAFRRHEIADTESDVPTTAGQLVLARSLLEQRSDKQAMAVLNPLEPATPRERIDWHLLQALALQHQDLGAAFKHAGLALRLAEPHGFLTSILATGPGVVDLLRALPVEGVLVSYVDRLLRAAETGGHTTRRMGAGTLVEGLSSRERTVLSLLCSRLTSREIASTLFISSNTLKTHTKSIYRKLGVSSRAEAAAQARSMGVTSPS